MQGIPQMFGLYAIFFIALIPYIMAESDEHYLQILELYDEQRQDLEDEFFIKFKESSSLYKEEKQAISEKSESDPALTHEQINQMLTNSFNEFVKRHEGIKKEYDSRVDALDAMFGKKIVQFDNKTIQNDIPSWVNDVVTFWDEGKISDIEYVNYLSFLVDNGVIKSEQLIFFNYVSFNGQLINLIK